MFQRLITGFYVVSFLFLFFPLIFVEGIFPQNKSCLNIKILSLVIHVCFHLFIQNSAEKWVIFKNDLTSWMRIKMCFFVCVYLEFRVYSNFWQNKIIMTVFAGNFRAVLKECGLSASHFNLKWWYFN